MARIKRRIRRMNFLTQKRRIEPIKETTDKYMKDEFLGYQNSYFRSDDMREHLLNHKIIDILVTL